MIQQLFTIGRNTFIESIRQPIFAVLVLVGILALILAPTLSAYTFDDDNKLLIDMGLSTLLVIGCWLAGFTATGVISREIENRTVLTVISKPISRPVFVLGKFLGISAAIGVAYWILCITFLLDIRHRVMDTAGSDFDTPVLFFGVGALLLALFIAALGNYFYHWVFNSSFMAGIVILGTLGWAMTLFIGKHWVFQPPTADINPELMKGMLLLFMGLLLIVSVSIACSTRLGEVMTLLICFGVVFVGFMSDYWLGQAAARYGDETTVAGVFYRIIPNLQIFWPADSLTQSAPGATVFTREYLGYVAAYCGALVAGMLCLAVALFQTREVG